MPADLTLSHLRTLIDTAAAKSGRAVEDITNNILPRVVWTQRAEDERGWVGAVWTDQIMMLGRGRVAGSLPLDLTDPGTAHAVVVALALALGLDPGPAGLCAAWRPLRGGSTLRAWRCGWWLSCDGEAVYFLAAADATGDDDEVVSDAIAAEPDDLAALVAACKLAIKETTP